MTRNPMLLLAAGFASVFLAGLVAIIMWVSADSANARTGPFNARFALLNDEGQPVDESLFKGAPSLVYFGYTHCPEVCPTTLFEVSGWLKALGPEGDRLKAYFFTVDPTRDTPSIMHAYVRSITDRITGITGTPEEMKKVTEGWMIHAARSYGDDSDYHMSHTTSLLLIGADGRLKGMIPYGEDQDQALSKIRERLL
ncbi:SCO family protein [Rhizobium sp. SSA_523]|uniref:SCO family protein n=1 Tax=Rhizobium sp. SSA_523 TaxID=2952477 RepID=UPI0020912D10|nr:SCO family protein [Rhizobium sp. SSA_523]MCO5733197.1 SCO family protein [Rhizobium sp. SSA_523]WKC21812.1 SCO family protein [Rhizobium sp. SSA_523]